MAPHLGGAYQSYSETGHPDYSSVTARLGVEAGFRPSEQSIVKGYGAFDLLTILSNGSDKFRLLSLGARAGLRLTGGSVEIHAMTGVLFRTMLVSNGAYGVRNLTGVELYPELRYSLNPKSFLSGRLRYAPIFDGLSLNGSSYELGAALGWESALSPNSNLRFEIEITQMRFVRTVLESKLLNAVFSAGLSW